MFQSSQLLNLVEVLVKVVAHLSFLHELGASFRTLLDVDDVLSAVDPLLEALSHHDAVCHVSDSGQFSTLAVGGPDSLSLLTLFLGSQGVLQVLVLILEIFSHNCKLDEMLLVSRLLPFVKSFGQAGFMEVDQS